MSINFPLYTPSTTNSGDVYYNEDTLLLHADGVTGATNNYVVDASTNTFVITRVGTPTQGSVNPFGSNWSAYFNGSVTATVYVSTVTTSSFAFGSNNFTIEAWINAASTVSNYPLIIGNYATTFTTNAWGLYYNRIDTGNFYFSTNNGGMTLASGSAYVVPGWNHVAVVRNGATVSLFVNGTQTSSFNYGATSLDGGAAARLYIGDAGGTDTTTRYNGYISNLRVVNGSAVYTGTFTPSVVPLSTVTNTALLSLSTNYFQDISTNSFVTTATSGVSIQRFNPFGNTQTYAISSATVWGSTYFDGSTGYLTLPSTVSLSGSGNWTFETWVNPINSGSTDAIISLDVNASYYASLRIYHINGQLGLLMSTTGSSHDINTTSIGNLVSGAWSHIAITKNGTSVNFYLNGVQQGSTFTLPSASLMTGTYYFIGYLNAGSAQLLHGYLSNLRIVKGTVLYTANFTPSTVPLTTVTNTVLLTGQYSNSLADVSTASNVISATGVAVPTLRSPFARVDTSTAATLYGGSMYFNGSTDYSTTTNAAAQLGTGNFTIECWIYLVSKISTYPAVFSNYNSFTTGALALFADHASASGKYTLAVNGTWPAITSNISVVYNAWTHIALVRNSGVITMYINGVANGTYSFASSLNGVGTIFYIGNSGDVPTQAYINGYLSNFRIANTQALYTSNFIPSTVPLTTSSQGSNSTALLIPGVNAGIYDSNMQNNIVTVGSAQISSTSTATVKFGSGSVKFNGSTDYLLFPSNPNFNLYGNYTIEFWTYLTTTASQTTFFTLGDSFGSSGFELYYSSGSNQVVLLYNNAGRIGTGQALTVNTWYHFALVRNNGSTQIYINGIALGSPYSNSSVYSGILRIGVEYYNGAITASTVPFFIDDFRITNGLARYTATFTPPTASFADIQLVTSPTIGTPFTTATNIGSVTWGYNTATTRWSGIQEPTASTNLTPANIEDQINTSTGYFSLPTGTTDQRPVTPQGGYMRFNTTLDSVEYYNLVTGWTTIP